MIVVGLILGRCCLFLLLFLSVGGSNRIGFCCRCRRVHNALLGCFVVVVRSRWLLLLLDHTAAQLSKAVDDFVAFVGSGQDQFRGHASSFGIVGSRITGGTPQDGMALAGSVGCFQETATARI